MKQKRRDEGRVVLDEGGDVCRGQCTEASQANSNMESLNQFNHGEFEFSSENNGNLLKGVKQNDVI